MENHFSRFSDSSAFAESSAFERGHHVGSRACPKVRGCSRICPVYCLTHPSLHRDTPFRLLLSVPSIKTFLATWTITEPSEIDLHILRAGRIRKGNTSLENVLRVRQRTRRILTQRRVANPHFNSPEMSMNESASTKSPSAAAFPLR